MATSPGSRTLTVTISVDNKSALTSIKDIQDALARLTGKGMPGAGGGANNPATQTGNAAKQATKDVEGLLKALKKIQNAGGADAAAAKQFRSMIRKSAGPAGQENTDVLAAAQALVRKNEAAMTKAGLRGTGAKSLVTAQRQELEKLGAGVVKYGRRVNDLVKLTGAAATDQTKIAFKGALEYSKTTSANVLKQFDLLQQKRAEYAKRRGGDLSISTTSADVRAQERALKAAQDIDRQAKTALRSRGREMYTSAQNASAAAKKLAADLEAVGKAGDRAQGRLAKIGDTIKTSMERVRQNVADMGGSPDKALGVAVENFRKKAEREYAAVEKARQKAFKVKAAFVEGKASGADVAAAFGDLNRKAGQLDGTMRKLRGAQNAYEQSTYKSATATYKLERGMAQIARTTESAKKNLTAWGDKAASQVERVNRYVANKGVGAASMPKFEFKSAGDNYRKALADYRTAVEDANKIKEKFFRGEATGAQVAAGFDKVKVAAGGVKVAYREMAAAGDGVIASSKEISKTLSHNQEQLDKARRSAYAWSIAGYQLQATLGIVTQQLKDAVSSYTDFDFTVRRAAGALSIFDQSGAAFERLGASIQDTAIKAKLFDPKEIAQGYYFWGSMTGQVVSATDDLNKSQAELLKLQNQVLPIMQVAAITQTDLETAMKGVYSIMSQYDMPIESAQKVTEKLFLVTQKTAAEFPDLIESFKMVGPSAAQLGIPFGDLVGMFGALSDAGVRGSSAGRALRQTIIKLTDPTVRASKALDEAAVAAFGVGSSFQDIIFPDGEFIGMQGYLDALSKMTKNLSQEEMGRLLGIITTQNEVGSLTQLIKANTKAREANTDGVIDSARAQYSDAAAREYTTQAVRNQMDSAAASFGELNNVVQSTMQTIGANIWEMIKPAVKLGTEIAKTTLALMQTDPQFAKLAAGIVLVSGVAVALGSSLLIAAGAAKLLHAVMAFDLLPKLFESSSAARGFGKVLSSVFGTPARLLLTGFGKLVSLAFAPFKYSATMIGVVLESIAAQIQRTIIRILTPVFTAVGAATGAIQAKAHSVALTVSGWWAGVWARITAIQLPFATGAGTAAGTAFGVAMRIAAMAAAVAAPLVAVISVALVAKDQQNGINEMGDALKKQATDFAKTATDEQLENAIAGVRKELDGMVFNSYDSKNKVIAVLNELIAEANRRANRLPVIFAESRDQVGPWFDQSMVDKMFADKNAFEEGFSASLSAAVKGAFKKGKRELADAAIDSAKFAMDQFIARFATAAQPAVTALTDGVTNLLKSDNTFSQKIGQALIGPLSDAFKSGNIEKVKTSISKMLESYRKAVENENPKNRRASADSLYSLLSAYTNVESITGSQDLSAKLSNAMLLLVTPGMETAGVEAAKVFFQAAGLAIASVQPSDFEDSHSRRNIRSITPFDLSKLPTITDPPGGGGGGGGKTQSPLEKALEVAKNSVDLAESLQKLTGVDVKSMVQKSMKPLAEAMLLADKITYDVTKSFGKKKLQQVAEFADASGKLASTLGTAIDAFVKLGDYERPPAAKFKAISRDLIVMTNYIKDAASHFHAKGLAAAQVFADSAGPVVTLIGSAFDAFSKITDFESPSDEVKTALVTLINDMVIAIGEVATKIKTELVKSAKDFSEAAGPVMTLIGGTFDAFGKTAEFVVPTQAALTALKETVRMSVVAISEIAKEYDTVDGRKTLTAIEEFGKAVGPVMSAIKATFDAYLGTNITDPDHEKGERRVNPIIENIVEQIRTTFVNFKSLVDDPIFKDTGLLTKAAEVAKTANDIVQAVGAFFDLGNKLGEKDEEGNSKNNAADAARMVSVALSGILGEMRGFVDQFQPLGGDIVTKLAAGMKSQESVLMDEVRAINSILASMGATITISAGDKSISMTVNAEANKVTVVHRIEDPNGAVASMTPAQRDTFVQSGYGFLKDLDQAGATR